MATGDGLRKTSVLVVEDQRTFAQALAMVLALQHDMRSATAGSWIEAERAVAAEVPDVILVDVAMPGADGVEVAARLIARHPGLRVLILSAHDDDLLRSRALAAGVHGFLSTFEPLELVLDGVRRAMSGDLVRDRVDEAGLRLRGRRRRIQHATERQRSERLSPRERQILQLMVDGLEPPEISMQLSIRPATLRTHVQNIITKLGVHSKTQAVLLAVRQGRVTTRG
jgi:DNA-binding NarL/FixJ family response regulator